MHSPDGPGAADGIVPARHAAAAVQPGAAGDLALSDQLRRERSSAELLALAAAHASGDTDEDARMRRIVWRAMVRRCGHGLRIGRAALAKHPETFELGDG